MPPPDDDDNAEDQHPDDGAAEDVIADARRMLASARSLIQVIALAAERFEALDRAVVQRLAGNVQSELADADALHGGFCRHHAARARAEAVGAPSNHAELSLQAG